MSQESKVGGTSTASGATCTKTGVYKATDGKIEIIQYIYEGSPFPPFPGGTATTKCTWTPLSTTADGTRKSFTAVKVPAGTQ